MAETNDSLPYSFAIAVLAKRDANKMVKEDLRATQEYLATHPELLTQAERLIASESIFREFRNDRARNGMATQASAVL